MIHRKLLVLLPLLGSPAVFAGPSGAVYDSFLNLMPIGNLVDAMSLDQLAEMVVTESKVVQSQASVTQKILVLNAENFEQQTSYHRNLAELMRYSAGQFVNVLSRNDANWGSYAGLGPKYNSYLLDGLPIDSFVDAMSLDPWAFERLEAYKGPASVLYPNYLSMDFAGAEAPLTGTTNFVLKDRVDVPMTRLQAGYGADHTLAARLYSQGRVGEGSYLFGGAFEDSDYSQYGEQGSWLQTVDDPQYQKRKLYGKWSQALGEDGGAMVAVFASHRSSGGYGPAPPRLRSCLRYPESLL